MENLNFPDYVSLIQNKLTSLKEIYSIGIIHFITNIQIFGKE